MPDDVGERLEEAEAHDGLARAARANPMNAKSARNSPTVRPTREK